MAKSKTDPRTPDSYPVTEPQDYHVFQCWKTFFTCIYCWTSTRSVKRALSAIKKHHFLSPVISMVGLKSPDPSQTWMEVHEPLTPQFVDTQHCQPISCLFCLTVHLLNLQICVFEKLPDAICPGLQSTRNKIQKFPTVLPWCWSPLISYLLGSNIEYLRFLLGEKRMQLPQIC